MGSGLMRLLATILACPLVWLAISDAAAREGFVVEATNARPEVGSYVRGDTTLAVEDGGSIVLMTYAGQLVRREGPYHGQAASLLDAASRLKETHDLTRNVFAILLALAEVNATSTKQLSAARGAAAARGTPADTISATTRVFCLERGDVPYFFTSRPPPRNEPLVMRRRRQLGAYEISVWPAAKDRLRWPSDWPAPEEGRYIWALGSRGVTALRIRMVENLPSGALERAAFYFDLDCNTQATAVFQAALDGAEQR